MRGRGTSLGKEPLLRTGAWGPFWINLSEDTRPGVTSQLLSALLSLETADKPVVTGWCEGLAGCEGTGALGGQRFLAQQLEGISRLRAVETQGGPD